jgi:hypothetical protein
MSNIGFLMQPRARFNDFIQLFGNSMNKSYRSLWNESLGAWVAASELTRAGGKRSGARVVAAVIVAAAAWGGLSGVASAAVIGAPVQAQDGNYSSGAASATGEAARVKVVVASSMQPAAEYLMLANACERSSRVRG